MQIARASLTFGLIALAAAGLAACAPEDPADPDASPSESPTATETPDETAEPSEEPAEPATAFAMPADCSAAYSAEMFRTLGDAFALNDPDMTLLSTQTVGALEILDGVDSLRCGWGVPSEIGIASTIAEIDAEQELQLRDVLGQAGFECDDAEPTTCVLGETINEDAGQSTATETHVFGEGGWVATSELNSGVEPGYSEDMRDALWK